MKKIIGIVLIIVAMAAGYMGITNLSNSGKSLEIAGLELSATDEGKQTTGFVYAGLAVICLIGGITLVGKK